MAQLFLTRAWRINDVRFRLTQVFLHLLGYFRALPVLALLVLWLDELGQVVGMSTFLLVERVLLELAQMQFLLLLVVFGYPLSGGLLIRSIAQISCRVLIIILTQVKLLVVLVGVEVILELLPVDFVQHVINNLQVEVRLRVELEQFLVLTVEHYHEHLNTAEAGKLDGLFEKASLPFAHSDFSPHRVLDKAWHFILTH